MRSALTAAGVAVAVAAGVALVHLAWGFERAVAGGYQARGADLIVGRVTSQRPLTTPFPEGMAIELQQMPEVAETAGMLGDLLTIEEQSAVAVLGWQARSFLWSHLDLMSGAWPEGNRREVALGSVAAELLNKRVGDTVHIETSDFRVTAVFASPAVLENGAVVMPLTQIQELGGRDGLVSLIAVRLRPGVGASAIQQMQADVRTRFPGFSAATGSEAVQRNIAVQAGKAVSLAVSVVALALSTLAVVNTMIMSVFERTREVALLLAVGWRRSRVMRLIVTEAGLLTGGGGLLGCAFGVAILHVLARLDWFRSKVDTTLSIPTLVGMLVAAMTIGVLSGTYAAWSSTRRLPAEGLRYE